jgi:preprotein translocase SecE subunit
MELEKVSWPEKRILKVTTLVVIVMMFLMAIYIGTVDIIFSRIISLFLG